MARPLLLKPAGQVLVNLDADAYLESLNWVASDQALLGIDFNGDGGIEALELLSSQCLDWLDANHDGVIDARDPAFAAIRVWVDVNGDADSREAGSGRDETTSLKLSGISAIHLKTAQGPQIVRADGSRQALDVQTLTGDTLGVRLQVVAGAAGLVQTTEQIDGSGVSVLLAANTRAFDKQAGHVHGGEVVSAQADTPLVKAGDSRLQSTTNRTVANTTVQTTTTLTAGDKRLQQGAAGTLLAGQDSTQQTRHTADAGEFVSAGGSGALAYAGVVGAPAAPVSVSVTPALPRQTVVLGNLASTVATTGNLSNTLTSVVTALPQAAVVSGQVAGLQTVQHVQTIQAVQSAQATTTTGLLAQPPGDGGTANVARAGSTVEATTALHLVQASQISSLANSVIPQPVVQATHVATGDARITSAPASTAELAAPVVALRPTPVQITSSPAIAFIPTSPTTLVQQRRELRAEMIRSADAGLAGLGLGPGGAVLMGLALGATASASLSLQANAAMAGSANTDDAGAPDASSNTATIANADVYVDINTFAYANSHDDPADYAVAGLTDLLTNVTDTPGQSALQGGLDHTPTKTDTASGVAAQHPGYSTWLTATDEGAAAGDGGGSTGDSFSGLGSGNADSNGNTVAAGQLVNADGADDGGSGSLGSNSIRGGNSAGSANNIGDSIGDSIGNTTANTPVSSTSTSTNTPSTSPAEGTREVSSVVPAAPPAPGTPATSATPANAADVERPVLLGESFDGFEDRVLRMDAAQLLANDQAGGLQSTALSGSNLRLVGVSNAAHGQVALISLPDGSQQVVFTPDADYYGPASFSYTVVNSAGGVATATATVQLAEVNDVPTAVADTLAATEDTVLNLSAAQLSGNDRDPDTTNTSRSGAGAVANDVLTLTSVGHASHGTVALVTVAASTPDGVSTQQVVFTPNANYAGPASFTYTVSDGRGGFSSAEVFLNIAAVNDAPVATGEVVYGDEDVPLVIAASTLLANDRDVDNLHSDLRIASVGNPLHGTVRLNTDGSVQFTPDTDYNGQAGFDYAVSDGAGGISTARASINIASSNDAPSVQGETIAGVEDTPLIISSATLLANDGDIDSPHANLKITAVSHAVHGSVVLGADGNVRFTPEADYNSSGQVANPQGPARFDYTVSDGEGGSTTGTATLQIAAVNDAPVTTGEVITSDEDVALLIGASSLLANDRDIDNPHSDLRITAVGQAVHGTAVLNADGSVAFDAEANYSGRASFTYTVSDGSGGSTNAAVELNLVAVNDAPVTLGEVITSDEDVPLLIAASSLLVNDSDIDNPHSDLRITAVGHAVHGTVLLNANGSVGFTPDADYVGRATFDYTVDDGTGGATQATVAIDLANINDAPRLQNEIIASAEDTPVAIDSAALLQSDADVDNPHASLHITAVSAAVHGTALLNADGSVAFTPDADYAGQAGFDYTVSDGDGGVSTATATIQIAAVNDVPVATGEVVASNEDVPLLLTAANLLANDTDVDNPHSDLRLSAVGNAVHGNAVLNASGDVLFTPDADYVGRASFDYTVSDGAGGLTQATVALDLANVNDAPRLQTETVFAVEDTPLSISSATLLANDTDVDGPQSSLSISAVGHGVHGTALLNADGSVRFTPDADYNSTGPQGPASFEYTVSDGVGGTTIGIATVAVASVNDAPVAQGEVLAPVAEDTVLVFSSSSLLANDSDVDRHANNTRDTLTVAQVGHASHGTVALASDGTVTFTPEADYNGQAGFGYSVSDGAGGLSDATVSLTLTAVNDAPGLQAENLVSDQDAPLLVTAVSLLANDSDVDNPHADLHITAVAGAVHGAVALQTVGGSSIVNFTPDAGFKGQASFEYTVSDGAGGVSTATAQVRVLGVNHAPVAQADVLASQLEDTNLIIAASALLGNDSDVDIATDGQALHIGSVSAIHGQTHGVVGLNASGNVTFSPDQDYTGAVRFAYTVTDDASGLTPTTAAKSASSSVSFEVTNVNDAPQAAGDYIVAKNLTVVNIAASTLLANDRDPDLASAPTAGDRLSVTGVSGAQYGTAVLQADGSVQFVTTPGFHGLAQFTYDISDENGGSSSAVAQVNNVNAAPTVVGESGTILEDSVTTISSSILLANDSDTDNPANDLRIVGVTSLGAVTHGTVSLAANGDVTFTPELNYAGNAQFSYTVADGDGGQATGTVNLAIQQVNDAPVVVGEVFGLLEDQIASGPTSLLLANDTDIETPGSLSVTSVGNAQHGSVQLTGNLVTFTPDTNFNGSGAGFDYTVSDGQGGLSQAHAAFNYEPVNDAPVVNNEVFQALQDTSYTVTQSALLANDTDVETPQSLQISALYGASGATVEFQGANRDIRFTPTPGFSGNASFKYTVMDAQGATAEGTTTVTIAPVNHNPTATDDSFVGFEDQQFNIAVSQLLINDFDQDSSFSGDVLSVVGVSDASAGTVSLTGGTVSFMPSPDYAGPAGFNYTVSDGRGGSTSAHAYVTVNQVNDAPVVTGVMYVGGFDDLHFAPGTGDGSETYQPWDNPAKEHGSIQAYDIDGPGALYGYISQQPSYGSATVDSAGSWTYDGYALAYDGPDQFTVQVSDGIASTAVTIATYHGYVAPSGGGGGGGGGGGDITPIVVDLQGDGVVLLHPSQSNVFMDINGDGLRERLGWAAPSDAVLAFDANHDGRINKLEEISFTGYLPGAKTDLEGLRAFDSSGDSKLSAADAHWQDFGLLQDKNGNGVQDPGDFTLLDKTAVVSISLDRHGSPQNNHGNVVYGTSDVVLKDGTTVQASDASFAAIAWESAGKVVPAVTPPLTASATEADHPATTVTTAITTTITTATTSAITTEITTAPITATTTAPIIATTIATTSAPTAAAVIALEPVSSTSHVSAATTTVTPPPAASTATTAEVAQMALVFNSYANTATASPSTPPLAFVPVAHGATEVVMDLSSLHEAANNTANVLSLPVMANTTSTASLQALA